MAINVLNIALNYEELYFFNVLCEESFHDLINVLCLYLSIVSYKPVSYIKNMYSIFDLWPLMEIE